jgi:copper resistance protein B
MILIRTLIISSLLSGLAPCYAEISSGSVTVDELEYRSATDTSLIDSEAEYGTSRHRAVFKLRSVSSQAGTQTDIALVYRWALMNEFDLQAGIEFTNERRQLVFGFQGRAPRRIDTELLTIIDEHGDGYVSAKAVRDLSITERLVIQPKLEISGSMQRDADSGIGAGLSTMLMELRLRYERHPRFVPYIGASWERALGDTANVLEAASEDKSVSTVLAGVSFSF